MTIRFCEQKNEHAKTRLRSAPSSGARRGIRICLQLFAVLLFFFICTDVRGQDTDILAADSVLADHYVLARIIVSGNKVTRSSVILRELNIHQGDTIFSEKIPALMEQNKLRLFNLGLFNEVEQHIKHNGDLMEWDIIVKERWYIIPTAILQFADRNINTWWVSENHDLRRVAGGLTVTDKNFRGNLETLGITAEAGYTQKLGVSYMRPYLNRGQTNGLGFSISLAQSRQAYYTTDADKLLYAGSYSGPVISRQLEGGISYLYRPAFASRHIFQVSYKDYTVRDTIIRLNPDYFADGRSRARFVELFYRYEYNGVDNWNYSLQGFKLVTYAALRQGMEGIGFQSFANIEAGLFRNPLPRWYYSAVFRGRLMYPQDQPYYFRGGLGTQTDYVRGYEYYVIDGGNYGLLRLDLKRELFNRTYSAAVKYFTAIPLRIYPKIFADAGYINSPSPGNSTLSNRLLYSFGMGLDIVTLYDIKIRVEFAWNHLKQKDLYLHFNSE
jgi:outer membrane protein assembly factor BamA